MVNPIQNGLHFLYEPVEGGMRILRVFGRDDCVALPKEVEGRTVTELGAYAFSDRMDQKELKDAMERGKLCGENGEPFERLPELPELSGDLIREVSLPASLSRVGRYAFYNCRNLTKLEFSGKLVDLGAGALSGCHQVRRLGVKLGQQGTSCLREILTELPEEIQVELLVKGERGCFLFPEFFEEGVENTPARILENHVHGSGIRYRNCFIHRTLNIKEYDELFPYAVAWETETVVTELALNRVFYPMELAEKARDQYVSYLKEHFLKAADLLRKQQAYQALDGLITFTQPSREQAETLLNLAVRDQDRECVSLLMECLHRREKRQRRVFKL